MKALTALLKEEISIVKRRKIELSLTIVVEYIILYELTEALIKQYREICADTYNEVDTIRDRLGRKTHVYIMFVPVDKTKTVPCATTNVAQTINDADAYSSEFGPHTVSVKVQLVNKALELLAHELGHVKYQVPNLKGYMKFYNKRYGQFPRELNCIGHDDDDISGKTSEASVKHYKKHHATYLKEGHAQFQYPAYLSHVIRKQVKRIT